MAAVLLKGIRDESEECASCLFAGGRTLPSRTSDFLQFRSRRTKAASCFQSGSESFGGAADGCDCFSISRRSNRNRLSVRRGGYRTEENFILSVVGGDRHWYHLSYVRSARRIYYRGASRKQSRSSTRIFELFWERGLKPRTTTCTRDLERPGDVCRHVGGIPALVCGGEVTLQVVI